MTVVFCH